MRGSRACANCRTTRTSRSCSTRPRLARISRNNAILQKDGKKVIDLTPAAIGPFTIPVINGDANIDEPNVNMVTCGGQATIPMVYAVKRATKRVIWGEIVASISSKSAGPGTRANIDEFTETTSNAIVQARRRGEGQGDHHPEPGRAAADHARHGVHAVAGRHAGGDREVGRRHGASGAEIRAGLSPEAEGAVRAHRRQRVRCASRASGSAPA